MGCCCGVKRSIFGSRLTSQFSVALPRSGRLGPISMYFTFLVLLSLNAGTGRNKALNEGRESEACEARNLKVLKKRRGTIVPLLGTILPK